MTASTPAEFEILVPREAGLTFEVFGNATQHIVEALQNELFPNQAVLKARLHDLCVRHPNRQG